ncbi:MAG: methionyl-tRNA formyltransferase [Coriobacteriia bacterium]|nr:methionyl-tRNA formyltransferase [Coriobacteriia bacterium]
MRVVFMGTPDFAVPTLKALHADDTVELVAVYTRPDAVCTRGSTATQTPVGAYAAACGYATRTPCSLRDKDEIAYLAACAPDLIVVVAFGAIVPPEVLTIPRLGCVNVHASLLPRWRGAAPIARAILAGDTTTGVSIMQMDEGLDTGPYGPQVVVDIADKDCTQLEDELAQVGAETLKDMLPALGAGTVRWIAQDEAQAVYADKITKNEMKLTRKMAAEEIVRRVRASTCHAYARTQLAEHDIVVLEATAVETDDYATVVPDDTSITPGTVVVTKRELLLVPADAAEQLVRLEQIKPTGRCAMSAADWARGARLTSGMPWG